MWDRQGRGVIPTGGRLVRFLVYGIGRLDVEQLPRATTSGERTGSGREMELAYAHLAETFDDFTCIGLGQLTRLRSESLEPGA